MMDQDPFEEFEFKPITDGLGFHGKKKSKLFEKDQNQNIFNTHVSIHESQNKSSPTHIIEKPYTDIKPSTPKVEQVLEQIKTHRKNLTFDEKPSKTNSPPAQIKLIPSQPEITAIFLDFLLILSAVLSVLIVTILTTKIDFFSFLGQSSLFELGVFVYIIFSVTSFIYTTSTRLFFNQTVGEWVTDQKILVKEQSSISKLIRICFRSILVIMTGYLILPILSWIFSHSDLVGKISGASLVKEKL